MWHICMEAEERSRFLAEMRRRGLGTADVEEHSLQQSKLRKNANMKRRNIVNIRNEMGDKLRDARMEEGKSRRARDTARREFEREHGRTSDKVKKAIKRIKEKTVTARTKVKVKYRQRMEHLEEKYAPRTNNNIPEDLLKYSEAGVFNNNNENWGDDSKEEEKEQEVIIIGNVVLSEEERSVLQLPPKFGIMDKLSDELAEVELQSSSAKHRWEASKLEEEELIGMSGEEEERIKAEMELMEAKSRQMYDPEENNFDMGRLKATDVKHNTRITLPQPGSPLVEAMIAVREEAVRRIRSKYKEEFTSKDGQQKSNLSTKQRRGLKSLVIRVKNGEIVVLLTDKSGRLAVMTLEDYHEAGMVHVKNDKEVD